MCLKIVNGQQQRLCPPGVTTPGQGGWSPLHPPALLTCKDLASRTAVPSCNAEPGLTVQAGVWVAEAHR